MGVPPGKPAQNPDQEGQAVVYDHCAFLEATEGGMEDDTPYSPSNNNRFVLTSKILIGTSPRSTAERVTASSPVLN